MEEKNMIPIKQEKEKKVEIIKDLNSATDSEKELDSQKEQERKERIFLIQLIVVFVVWVFLIIMVMKDEKLPPKKVAPKPQVNKQITQNVKPHTPTIQKPNRPSPTIDNKKPNVAESKPAVENKPATPVNNANNQKK